MVVGRVNGILAVTRSLGDRAMKQYVIGDPYTEEHELKEGDSHLILACDGVWAGTVAMKLKMCGDRRGHACDTQY